jgi:hypothetical protein
MKISQVYSLIRVLSLIKSSLQWTLLGPTVIISNFIYPQPLTVTPRLIWIKASMPLELPHQPHFRPLLVSLRILMPLLALFITNRRIVPCLSVVVVLATHKQLKLRRSLLLQAWPKTSRKRGITDVIQKKRRKVLKQRKQKGKSFKILNKDLNWVGKQ